MTLWKQVGTLRHPEKSLEGQGCVGGFVKEAQGGLPGEWRLFGEERRRS